MNTQPMEFVNAALAGLFHDSAESFLTLLNRDGTRLLRFYWDKAGQKIPLEQRRDVFGLNYVIRKPRRSATVALITLPAPQVAGEAYFTALAYRPNRRLLLVSDTTAVFALEAVDPQADPPQTQLVAWSKRLEREPLRRGLRPDLEDFYAAVLDEIRE